MKISQTLSIPFSMFKGEHSQNHSVSISLECRCLWTYLTLQFQSASLLCDNLSRFRLILDLNIWRSCNYNFLQSVGIRRDISWCDLRKKFKKFLFSQISLLQQFTKSNQEICMFYKFFPIQYFSFLYYHVTLIMFICLIFLQLDQLEECL